MWAQGIFSLGFDIDPMQAAAGQNSMLEALDIPDKKGKVGSFIPFDRTTGLSEELTAKHIKYCVWRLIWLGVPAWASALVTISAGLQTLKD